MLHYNTFNFCRCEMSLSVQVFYRDEKEIKKTLYYKQRGTAGKQRRTQILLLLLNKRARKLNSKGLRHHNHRLKKEKCTTGKST